jgi:hypothetical protein
MMRLLVELPVDREKCGRLSAVDTRGRTVLGPFAVAGRASSKLAAANRNPNRDPRFRFGDTPTGEYEVRQVLKSGKGTLFPAAEFGPHSVIVLEGVSGDAATAEANGRFHFLIQGGKTSANDRLRATAGSLRLANDDLRSLVALLRKHEDATCSIDERAASAAAARVDDDPALDHQDPVSLGSPVQVALSGRSLSRREAMLSGSAGAMSFGLSVTFVGIRTATPARAYTRLAYGEGAAPANGAMQQLENATGGNQTTGQTFDNGAGPTDATPQGGSQEPPTPPAAPAEPQPAPEPQQPEPPPPEPPPPEPAPEPAPAPEPEPAPQPEPPPPEPEPQPQPAPAPEPAPEPPPPPQGSTQSGPTYSAPTQAPTTYGPGDERQTPGGVNTIDGSGGQPISGAGVTQGPSDTPPPPNPTPASPRYVPNTSAPSYSSSPPSSSSPPPPPAPSAPSGAPRSLAPRSTPPSYSAPPSSYAAPSSPTPPTSSTTSPTPPSPAPVSSSPPPPAPSATGALTRAQAKKNLDAAYLALGAKRKAMNALIAQRKATKDPAQQKALDAQIAAAKHEVALAGQVFTGAKQAFDSIKK